MFLVLLGEHPGWKCFTFQGATETVSHSVALSHARKQPSQRVIAPCRPPPPGTVTAGLFHARRPSG